MKKLLLALACSAGVLLSQGNTALLRGSITDPSGAPAPGAAVAATNVQTKLAARTVTNERGEYALPSMPSGVYEITASKNGFKVARKSDIEIAAGVDTTVNVRLEGR